MLKKLLLLVVAGFLASCAATNTEQGGDVDAASSSSASGGDITAGTQEDLIVNVGDRVFFEFDSSELTVDAQATLDAQAAWLQQYPDTQILQSKVMLMKEAQENITLRLETKELSQFTVI